MVALGSVGRRVCFNAVSFTQSTNKRILQLVCSSKWVIGINGQSITSDRSLQLLLQPQSFCPGSGPMKNPENALVVVICCPLHRTLFHGNVGVGICVDMKLWCQTEICEVCNAFNMARASESTF